MNRLTVFHSLIPLARVLALACLVATAGCSSSPTAPPVPDPGAPTLTCPASVSQLSSLGIPLAISFNLPTVTGGFAPISGPVCTPPPGSSFGQGATTVNCTATDAKNRAGTCSFTVTVNYPPKVSATRFIAFGDSITWGEDGQNALLKTQGLVLQPHVQLAYADTYPGALQILLVGRYTLQSPTVANDGHPGQDLLDPLTLPGFKAQIVGYDSVLIMMGSNDLRHQDATLEPGMIAQYGSMIDFARSVNVKPVLATLPPMNPAGCCPIDRAQGWQLVGPFDDQIRALATSRNVPLADVYNAFNGDLTLIGPDGLHPDAAGYHVIAQTFFKTIQNSFEVTTGNTTTAGRSLSPARRSR